MAELTNVDSSDLTLYLLKKYNILIKDLSSKKGFENKNFIRIAVKSLEENNLLIEALKKYSKDLI